MLSQEIHPCERSFRIMSINKRYFPTDDGRVVDGETGEVVDRVFVAMERRKARSIFGKRWYAMSQDQGLMIARRGHEIGLDGFRVMHYLASVLNYENEIVVSHTEIAEALNMKRSNVSRAIRRLLEIGIIEKGPVVSRACSYRLSPEIGWKGSAVNHRAMMQGRKLTLADRMKKSRIAVVT